MDHLVGSLRYCVQDLVMPPFVFRKMLEYCPYCFIIRFAHLLRYVSRHRFAHSLVILYFAIHYDGISKPTESLFPKRFRRRSTLQRFRTASRIAACFCESHLISTSRSLAASVPTFRSVSASFSTLTFSISACSLMSSISSFRDSNWGHLFRVWLACLKATRF